MLAENTVNESQYNKIEFYKFFQSELILVQSLKRALLKDYKNREYTKEEFRELMKELNDSSILYKLASKDIKGQLLEELGEKFIKKLKGGQLHG